MYNEYNVQSVMFREPHTYISGTKGVYKQFAATNPSGGAIQAFVKNMETYYETILNSSLA